MNKDTLEQTILKKAKLEKEAEEKKKKEDEEKNRPKPYDVFVEVLVPLTVKYKVMAPNPDEAIAMIEQHKVRPMYIKPPQIQKGKVLSFTVFIAGTINKLLSKKK